MTDTPEDRILPAAIAAGLVAFGTALWTTRPEVLDLPEAKAIDDSADDTAVMAAATQARDALSKIAPSNAGRSLGRSLIIAGALMLSVRFLDEIIGRSQR